MKILKTYFVMTALAMVPELVPAAETSAGGKASGSAGKARGTVESFVDKYYHPGTKCLYTQNINGPRGIAVLETPEEIQKGNVKGEFKPYGYGSGIVDTSLLGGQLLFSLCEAYDASEDEFYGKWARNLYDGFKLMAGLSPVKGFVPRGPHPDGKSYYTDISRDQISATIYGLWRFHRSKLASPEDRKFIQSRLSEVMGRLEENGWKNLCEDGKTVCRMAGGAWDKNDSHAATTMLPSLLMVHDVTQDSKWLDYYNQFLPGQIPYLDPQQKFEFHGHPLFIYQQMYKLIAFEQLARKYDPGSVPGIKRGRKAWGEALPAQEWPRTKDLGKYSEDDFRKLGWPKAPAENAFEGWKRFDANFQDAEYLQQNGIKGKTIALFSNVCIHIPLANFYGAYLSGDKQIVEEVTPLLDEMLVQVDFSRINNGFVEIIPVLYALQVESAEQSSSAKK